MFTQSRDVMSYTSHVSTPLSDVIVNQSYNEAWYAFDYDDRNSSSDVALYNNVKVVSQYALPVIFVFGTLGNALCVAVFARKLLTACSSRSGLGDNIELSAASGFSLLAISDLLLCFSGLPDSFLSNVGHADRGDVAEVARLYVRVIQPVLLNLWIFTSTWITCALSTERYLVITYPLQAKRRCSATLTVTVSLGIFTASLALNFPYFFKYAVHCDRTDCFLMPAKFLMDPVGSVAYHVVWSLFGCVVPLCVLCFCNMRLLIALRRNRTLSFGTRMRGTRVGSREREGVKNDCRRKVSGGLEDKVKRGEEGKVDTDAGANGEVDGRGETELLGNPEGDSERRRENVVGGGGNGGEGPLTRRHARSLEKDGGRRARQVTLILVLIVTSYLLLVTPASCLELVRPLLPRRLLNWYRIAVVVTNTTQAAHFSCGFLLYACTSVRFRRDVGRLFRRCFHLPSGASSGLGLGLTRSACVLASTIDSHAHAHYRHSLLGQRLSKLHAGHGLAKSRL